MRWWVKRDVNRFAPVEGDRREVLVEEWFKHNYFITLFQKGHEYRILTLIFLFGIRYDRVTG